MPHQIESARTLTEGRNMQHNEAMREAEAAPFLFSEIKKRIKGAPLIALTALDTIESSYIALDDYATMAAARIQALEIAIAALGSELLTNEDIDTDSSPIPKRIWAEVFNCIEKIKAMSGAKH